MIERYLLINYSKKKPKLALVLSFISILSILVLYEVWPRAITGTVIQTYGEIQGQIHLTPHLSVQFWLNDTLFATNREEIYRSRDKGLTWAKVAKIEKVNRSKIESFLNWISELNVMRPFSKPYPMPVRVLMDGTILAVSEGIYRGRLQEGQITKLKKVHSGPRGLLQGWDEDKEGNLYYGEYQLGNHSVTNLYWSHDLGKTWQVKNSFKTIETRHIHCVAYDLFQDVVWIATGDRDHESRILFSSDQGESFQELGAGSQDWRTVSLQFTEDAVFWGTDIPEAKNRLFQWSRINGNRKELLSVRNPFYYSSQDRNGIIYFSTGAEKPEFGGEKFAELWQITTNEPPKRLIKLPRGKLDYSGMIVFAQGTAPKGWVAFSPMNIEGHLSEAVVFHSN